MAENAEIVFTLKTGQARREVDRLKRDIKNTADESERVFSRETLQRNLSAFGGAAAGAAAIALGRPGEGLGGAALAANQQMVETLRQQGQANVAAGIASQNRTQLGIGAAQLTGATIAQRQLDPVVRAREQAIGQVTALFDPFARAQVDVSDELRAEALKVAFQQALSSVQNEAQTRRVQSDMESVLNVLGGGGS